MVAPESLGSANFFRVHVAMGRLGVIGDPFLDALADATNQTLKLNLIPVDCEQKYLGGY